MQIVENYPLILQTTFIWSFFFIGNIYPALLGANVVAKIVDTMMV